jgi:hypothetical protein
VLVWPVLTSGLRGLTSLLSYQWHEQSHANT